MPYSRTAASAVRTWPAYFVAAIVLLLGLGATTFAWRYFSDVNQSTLDRALAERVRASQGRATGFLALVGENITSMQNYLIAATVVEPQVFAGMSARILAQHPELAALAWVPSTSTEAGGLRAAIELMAINPAGPGAAMGSALDYMGTDLALDPDFRIALQQSDDRPSVVYRGLKPAQWLIISPVGAPPVQRGHLIAVVSEALLLQIAVAGRPEDGLAKRLVDPTGENGGPKVIYSEAEADVPDNAPTLTDVVPAFGRRFEITLRALPSFIAERSSRLPTYLALGGSAMTVLLAGFLFSLLSRNANIRQLVNRRTRELEEAYDRVRDSEMMAMQSEKMSSLGQMVAGVAHEINTPLGFISSNLQLLREHHERLQKLLAVQQKLMAAIPLLSGLTPEQRQSWLQAGVRQNHAYSALLKDEVINDVNSLTTESLSGIDRLTDLVATLKDFSRLDRARVEETDLNRCITETIKIAHNAVKQKAELTTDLGELPTVRCNPSQINQILLNLMTNAAQAIEGYGEVRVRSTVDGEMALIEVIDNGQGIGAGALAQIFEPFFTTKAQGEGTGLGLAISRRIAEEHHGTLEVHSVVGVGTTFSLRLPLSPG